MKKVKGIKQKEREKKRNRPEVGELKYPRQNNFYLLKNNHVRDCSGCIIFAGKAFVGKHLFSVGESFLGVCFWGVLFFNSGDISYIHRLTETYNLGVINTGLKSLKSIY